MSFDDDLPHYNVSKGVHKNTAENEVYSPVAMWIEALDALLSRMKQKGFDFSSVKGISGAGQQHASVYVFRLSLRDYAHAELGFGQKKLHMLLKICKKTRDW